jgi:glycosyltransferase involved in cell wall biosynthesis
MMRRKKNKYNTFLKLTLIKLAKNIAVSTAIAQTLHTPSVIIPNAYNHHLFHNNRAYPPTKDFVFVGRLVQQKGVHLLIQTFAQLLLVYPQASLTIIGDGPERQNLEMMAQNLGVQHQIAFLGWQKGRSLVQCLQKHYVMVIPSMLPETFGLVALEGLACGCAIIASNQGGLPEAVNGFGEIFDSHAPDQLYALMLKAMRRAMTPLNTDDLNQYLHQHHADIIAQQYVQYFK